MRCWLACCGLTCLAVPRHPLPCPALPCPTAVVFPSSMAERGRQCQQSCVSLLGSQPPAASSQQPADSRQQTAACAQLSASSQHTTALSTTADTTAAQLPRPRTPPRRKRHARFSLNLASRRCARKRSPACSLPRGKGEARERRPALKANGARVMRSESLGSTRRDACLVSIWRLGGQPLSRRRQPSMIAREPRVRCYSRE